MWASPCAHPAGGHGECVRHGEPAALVPRVCDLLRLGNVYGPGKSKSGGPEVVFAFARAMLRDERPVIHWYNQRGEHSENRIKTLLAPLRPPL